MRTGSITLSVDVVCSVLFRMLLVLIRLTVFLSNAGFFAIALCSRVDLLSAFMVGRAVACCDCVAVSVNCNGLLDWVMDILLLPSVCQATISTMCRTADNRIKPNRLVLFAFKKSPHSHRKNRAKS